MSTRNPGSSSRKESSPPHGRKARTALVFGVVQGVGFRPFVYRTARAHGVTGWVKNIGPGVEIHVESDSSLALDRFFESLKKDPPPLCLMESVRIEDVSPKDCSEFSIESSIPGKSFVFISPDISVCESCRSEFKDPQDRRYRYPFINCTDCGPRYTIVLGLPYDRPETTMKDFPLCPDCKREYSDPLDRRYHAQPIACSDCGPSVRLVSSRTGEELDGGIERAAALIESGKIVAVKGLGGFHLVCHPYKPKAVAGLRKIKNRARKPLALLARDLDAARKVARISRTEAAFLTSPQRPIVLLKKKVEIPGIAPCLDEYGVMLAYTPLHDRLLESIDFVVATSSNAKDAPIIKDEAEGLSDLCDYILTHNRPIAMRADDSLMKIAGPRPLFLRRARGYVPHPQPVPEGLRRPVTILALGAELKDTLSLYKNGYIVTSQFLGDLDEYQNYRYFEETIAHLTSLFEAEPALVVSDIHPDFRTTRYAERLGIPHIRVQHHFAHVLAPMLEHGISPGTSVLGISLDGFGFGENGDPWGAEFLIADYSGFQRIAHFNAIPLPGGDLAAKQPWRMAVAYLYEAFGSDFPRLDLFRTLDKNKIETVVKMISGGLNSPRASSCGRLFDAVSYLVGLAPETVEFEAEAPMRLESAAAGGGGLRYRVSVQNSVEPWSVDFRPMIRDLVKDLENHVPASLIAAKFHNTLGHTLARVAELARSRHGVNTVVLSGGVFLNRRLLVSTYRRLEKRGFQVIRPVLYSPNDESISIGQIAFALNAYKKS